MGRHEEQALTAQDLSLQLITHSGLPNAADALAYEPVQRLLAVRGSMHNKSMQQGVLGAQHLQP